MPKYTDDQIRTAIEFANSDGAPMLARGRTIYLSLPSEEQTTVNHSLRRIIERVNKIGPILALEIYTAAACKAAALDDRR